MFSNETHHNINHFGGGHCDALSLFYAVLRQEGYETYLYYRLDKFSKY